MNVMNDTKLRFNSFWRIQL